MLGDRKDQWPAARLEDLDYGDIDGICTAALVSTYKSDAHPSEAGQPGNVGAPG